MKDINEYDIKDVSQVLYMAFEDSLPDIKPKTELKFPLVIWNTNRKESQIFCSKVFPALLVKIEVERWHTYCYLVGKNGQRLLMVSYIDDGIVWAVFTEESLKQEKPEDWDELPLEEIKAKFFNPANWE